MLEIQHLSLTLKKENRPLLRDFSFVLGPRDKAALIGEEGNGKSTLLQALCRRVYLLEDDYGASSRLILGALRQAALRAAVACYSAEGVYPADVAYLQENYGLRYDTDTFILQYDAFAENILPEIRVLIRGVE